MSFLAIPSNWLAVLFVTAFFGLLLFFTLTAKKQRREIREIPAFSSLRKAVGMAVEAGSRLHIALGRGSLFELEGASALAGLTVLERVARAASISDRPPVATSGDSQLAILSQDALQTAYQAANASGQYDPKSGRLAGVTPLAYAAGAMAATHSEQVSATIMFGHFGSEVGLLTAAASQTRGISIGGSDDLSAQAVFYATNEEHLVGEETFASGAYLGSAPAHAASLQVQDIFRWLIIAAILVGALARLVGWM